MRNDLDYFDSELEIVFIIIHFYKCIFTVGTLGCVFIDNETHESGVTKCTTGEACRAFSSPVVHLVTPLSCVSLSMTTQPSVPAFITHANLKCKKYSHLYDLSHMPLCISMISGVCVQGM